MNLPKKRGQAFGIAIMLLILVIIVSLVLLISDFETTITGATTGIENEELTYTENIDLGITNEGYNLILGKDCEEKKCKIKKVTATGYASLNNSGTIKIILETKDKNYTILQKEIKLGQETIPENPQTITFENECEETCQVNIENGGYTVRAELSGNNTLYIANITYTIQKILEQELNETTNETEIIIEQKEGIIGQPVKWQIKIKSQKQRQIQIDIPEEAFNITTKKETINNIDEPTTKVNVYTTETKPKTRTVELEIEQGNNDITYYTEAPNKTETEENNKKIIKITSPDQIHYTNITAYTTLPENYKVKDSKRIKIYWREENKYIKLKNAKDTNSDGYIDYIEWTVPHLSEQTFEIIIEIKGALHLDSNKEFISDIYPAVRYLDNTWSEEIPNEDYVRVVFEKNLTSSRDITIFPRIVSGNPRIEVYEQNKNYLIAEFSTINQNQYNKVFLTGLQGSQDTFDLKIQGGSIEFDYITDPAVGNPYNFTNTDTNWAYSGSQAGQNVWATGTQLSAPGYINLTLDDVDYVYIQAGSGNSEPWWRFNFTLTETVASISWLQVNLSGYENAAEAATVYVWNYTSKALITVATLPTTVGTASVGLNFTSGIANIINSTTNVVTIYVEGSNFDSTDTDRVFINFVKILVSSSDIKPPGVTIKFPENITYNSLDLPLNFNVTLNEAGSVVLYSLDSAKINSTMSSGDNLNYNATNTSIEDGSYIFSVYANDTAGNMNATQNITFSFNSSQLNKCGTLNLANKNYTLQNNVNSTTTCYTIAAENISINGQYNQIIYGNQSSATAYYGIYSQGYNRTKAINLNITRGSAALITQNRYGIYYVNNTGGIVESVNSSFNTIGLFFELTNDTIINYAITSNNTDKGISMYKSKNITILNTNISTELNSIYIQNSSNIRIDKTFINDSIKDAIAIIEWEVNNLTIYNTTILNTNISYYDINTTIPTNITFINANPKNYTFNGIGIKALFIKEGIGEINFLQLINGTGTNLSDDIEISSNFTVIESSRNTGLNRSANITLYNLFTSFNAPFIRMNETTCPTTLCYNFTQLNAGTVMFNVTGGINYSVSGTAAAQTPPTNVTLILPARGDITLTNRTVTYQWFNATDVDNDPISYNLLVDDAVEFTSPIINITVPATLGADNVTYYSTTALNVDLRYFWKVRANDTITNSSDSEVRNFTVASTVVITLTTDNVTFGGLLVGAVINTSSPPYRPIVVKNSGNVLMDVNVSAITQLWIQAIIPTNNFRYRIDNVTGQEGAFNWSGSTTTYTAIPLANNTAIKQLNYTSNNSANMHIEITVPNDEPAGNKSSVLQITGWASA